LDRDVGALLNTIREAFARAKHERQRAQLGRLRQRFISPLAAFGRRKPVIVTTATVIFLAACMYGVYAFGSRPVFAARMLLASRPKAISEVRLPTRGPSHPSPADWRDEVLYYVLPDRFSDGHEESRPLLDPMNPRSAGTPSADPQALLTSGRTRWQGGTLAGVRSKLGYLKELGVTTILLAAVLKQRPPTSGTESYSGFSVQDFLDVDPHLGTRRDLVGLVSDAHNQGIRVILSAPNLTQTGPNWQYQGYQSGSPQSPPTAQGTIYPFGPWVDREGKSIATPTQPDDGVWPKEFQDPNAYERRGMGFAPKDDFPSLRRLRFSVVSQNLAATYMYWIALTDCDGLFIDGLWGIGVDDAREFTKKIRDYATDLGKAGFLIAADASPDADRQFRYLGTTGDPLDAVLDFNALKIGPLAKGLLSPADFFDGFNTHGSSPMAGNRSGGKRTLAMITNPYGVGTRDRISLNAASVHQIAAAAAVQLFTPGIPCLYYGDEQALALDSTEFGKYMSSSAYLREAMFGPTHPKKLGAEGLRAGESGLDPALPGFGPFGVSGFQAFDEGHPAYVRIAALLGVRRKYAALRSGSLQVAQVGRGGEFHDSGSGEVLAWSRSVGRGREGVLVIVNLNGTQPSSANVSVDPSVYPPGSMLTVVANTMHAAGGKAYKGTHPVTSQAAVKSDNSGTYVEIQDLGPSEVLVLAGKPVPEDTDFGQFQHQFRQNPYGYGSSGYYPPRKARQ